MLVEKRLIRSFGRIKSRKLSSHKNELLLNFYPTYHLDVTKLLDKSFLQRFSQIILEIGFGYGGFLFKMAKNNPQNLYIGCEPHLNGMINILSKLENDPLQNILLLNNDFRFLAKDLLKNSPNCEIFNQIFILFPDPWPKLKHHKRRLINQEFLDNILHPLLLKTAHNKINDSPLVIATDHDDYKTWILSNILKSNKFAWEAQTQNDWLEFPDYWHKTKYQKKATLEGRESIIIKLCQI